MVLLTVASAAQAAPVSPGQALQRAMDSTPGLRAASAAPRLAATRTTASGAPAVYVFNRTDSEGYFLLSADDCALPVLGYADSGSFNEREMSPAMKWWLDEYGRQIEFASARQAGSSSAFRARPLEKKEPIAPMVKSKWDQVAPYNAQCPLSGTERTYTGCVATAMAQVMNYWEYPQKGTGSISYTVASLQKKVSLNFGLKAFDWNNMADTYLSGRYTDAQADAVAYLMKACGYSVKMDYSLDASGALSLLIGNALTKYFSYDKNINYTVRSCYSTSEWNEMMYENLKNVGPVICGGGSALGGGHSFVCDGYDGNGFFHFNWGWSGMSDGYFALEALNPDALGSGGGSGGGYNFSQDAVFGIQPPTGKPVVEKPLFITQDGTLQAKIDGSKLNFTLAGSDQSMWVNYNPSTLKVKFGVSIENTDDKSSFSPIYRDVAAHRFSIQPGYGTSTQYFPASVDIAGLNLPDGSYRLTMGTCPVTDGTVSEAADGTGFVAVKPFYGCSNNVILNVAEGKYSVSDNAINRLKVKAEIVGDLYYGCVTRVRVTAENPTDLQLSSGLAPAFADSEGVLFIGESILVTVDPHSTVVREYATSLANMEQIYSFTEDMTLLFTLFDEESFTFYDDQFTQTVTMHPNPGDPVVMLNKSVSIEGATRERVNGQNVYVVPDAQNMVVTSQLKLREGYFAYNVLACICIPASSTQVAIETTAGESLFMEKAGDTADFRATLSYPAFNPETIYYLALAYDSPKGLQVIGSLIPFRFSTASSGVDEIGTDSAEIAVRKSGSSAIEVSAQAGVAGVVVSDISGRTLASGSYAEGEAPASILLDIPASSGSVVVVRVADSAGNSRAFKLIL